MASRPPWILGCSVFTRPSIISGKPVSSETSRTGRPASASALRVPPVETSSIPSPASARANSTTPDLSETEMRARETRRRRSVMMDKRVPQRERHSKRSGTTSQRQLRFVIATAAGAGGAGALHGVRGKGPLHAHHVAGAAIDDELHRAARSVRAGEIDALL